MTTRRIIPIVLLVTSLATASLILAGCQSRVESPLTGKSVPLAQAQLDLETKQKLDQAQNERELARAAAEAQRLREHERQAAEQAQQDRQRRTAKDRRDHERLVATVTAEATAKVRAASDALADSQGLTDAELERTLRTLRDGVQTQIDAKAAELEQAIAQRQDAHAAAQAAIDAAAKADAERWAVLQGVIDAVGPVVSGVPGGGAAVQGINALMAIAGGGAGLAFLRERSKRAKSDEEKAQREALVLDMEAKQARVTAQARTLSKGIVGIVDSVEIIKDKVGQETWNRIKTDIRGWQSPEAEMLVDAARNNQDPLATLIARDVTALGGELEAT